MEDRIQKALDTCINLVHVPDKAIEVAVTLEELEARQNRLEGPFEFPRADKALFEEMSKHTLFINGDTPIHAEQRKEDDEIVIFRIRK